MDSRMGEGNLQQGNGGNRMRATGAMENLRSDAESASRTAGTEIRKLVTDVEELLKVIAHVKDEDIARWRGKVESGLTATRDAIRSGRDSVNSSARTAATATDEYVHERPWTAVGVAALVGATVAILMSRR